MKREPIVPMTQEEFNAKAEDHKIWLKSEGKKGKRLELYNVDLRNMDLKEVDFTQSYIRAVVFPDQDINLDNVIFKNRFDRNGWPITILFDYIG